MAKFSDLTSLLPSLLKLALLKKCLEVIDGPGLKRYTLGLCRISGNYPVFGLFGSFPAIPPDNRISALSGWIAGSREKRIKKIKMTNNVISRSDNGSTLTFYYSLYRISTWNWRFSCFSWWIIAFLPYLEIICSNFQYKYFPPRWIVLRNLRTKGESSSTWQLTFYISIFTVFLCNGKLKYIESQDWPNFSRL